jgi:hypothetical protein
LLPIAEKLGVLAAKSNAELSHHRLTTTPTVAKASYNARRPDRRVASRIVELDHSST